MSKEFVQQHLEQITELRGKGYKWDDVHHKIRYPLSVKRLIDYYNQIARQTGMRRKGQRISDGITREMLLLWIEEGTGYHQIEAVFGFSYNQVQEAAKREGIEMKAIKQPKKVIDRELVYALDAQGYTPTQIARKLKCSVSGVNGILLPLKKRDVESMPLSAFVEPEIRSLVMGSWV